MKATQVIGQALVAETERSGLHYVWVHDVEGDAVEGDFFFPVVMERGDRVTVELDGEPTTLTVQQVVYQPHRNVIHLRLG